MSRALTVHSVSELRDAANYARTHENTQISCDPKATYTLEEDLLLQGRGTVLNGNGAKFIVKFTPNKTTGKGIVIKPTFKDAVPYAGQAEGVVAFPRGNAAKLTAALGGEPNPAYNEFAPIRYLGENTHLFPAPDYWEITTPAQNIQLLNINFELADSNVMVPLFVYYTKKCLIKNVVYNNLADNRGFMLVGNTGLVVQNCKAPIIGWNSCVNSTIDSCEANEIGGEECVIGCSITNNRAKRTVIGDITCSDITISNNTYANSYDGGSIAVRAGQRIVVTKNTCELGIWLGDTEDCSVLSNTVNLPAERSFGNYSKRAGNRVIGNSWQGSN